MLAPGGTFLGTTPFMLGVHQAPHDYHRFTNFELERSLEEAGFVDIEVVPLGNTYDTFAHIKQHFFSQLFDATEHGKPAAWLGVKIVWNIYKFVDILARPLYKLTTNMTWTNGYAFVCHKTKVEKR